MLTDKLNAKTCVDIFYTALFINNEILQIVKDILFCVLYMYTYVGQKCEPETRLWLEVMQTSINELKSLVVSNTAS